MMTKKQLKIFADDLQAKYFQGLKEKSFATENETYAQIEIVEWILNEKKRSIMFSLRLFLLHFLVHKLKLK